jgi:hypothetical protein
MSLTPWKGLAGEFSVAGQAQLKNARLVAMPEIPVQSNYSPSLPSDATRISLQTFDPTSLFEPSSPRSF